MEQPPQVFPSWLSPSPVLVTNPGGSVATQTSVVYLTPTYYGPSIPLGSLYVYGGTTFPPTVALPGAPATTTATPPTPLTTAIPTTSAITRPTTSSLSSPSTTSTTSRSVTTTTSTSSSSTPTRPSSTSTTTRPSNTTPLPTPTTTTIPGPTVTGQLSSLTKGQLVGVIVASILGLIFLFVLALFLYLWCRGRRTRRPMGGFQTLDDDTEYFVVPSGGRSPGEGSPRHSGEEADPFLNRPSAMAAAPIMTEMGAASRRYSARVPPPTTGSASTGSTGSNSGYGTVLDRPTLGFAALGDDDYTRRESGTVLSDEEMQRYGRESVLPDEDHYGDGYTGAYAYTYGSPDDPLVPPPRLIDPALSSAPSAFRPPFTSPGKKSSSDSEDGTLLIARRVTVDNMSVTPRVFETKEAGSGILGSIGLGLNGLANLSKKSWFKNLDSPRSSGIYAPAASSDPESDHLTPIPTRQHRHEKVDSFGTRQRSGQLGTLPDGSRPISSVSARSGGSNGTVWHDAPSSLSGSPAHLLAPLPAARTPEPRVGQAINEHTWMASSKVPSSPPTAQRTRTGSPNLFEGDILDLAVPEPTVQPMFNDYDLLDMPIPRPLDAFGSVSSIGTNSMLRQTPTGSSAGIGMSQLQPYPPGLEDVTVRNVGWDSPVRELVMPNPVHVNSSSADHFDLLDEAPPGAEMGWRALATASASSSMNDARRNGAFGTYVPIPSPGLFNSEQGSLHSMRSQFSPSVYSTGSSPAGLMRDNSSTYSHGSTSSRPSIATGMVHSLPRTGSITNDARNSGSSKRWSGGAASSAAYQSHGPQHQRRPSAPSSPSPVNSLGLHVPHQPLPTGSILVPQTPERAFSSGTGYVPSEVTTPGASYSLTTSPTTTVCGLSESGHSHAYGNATVRMAPAALNKVGLGNTKGRVVVPSSPAPSGMTDLPWAGGLDDWVPSL